MLVCKITRYPTIVVAFWVYSPEKCQGFFLRAESQSLQVTTDCGPVIHATLFPGFSPTRPTERERERPWKTLVTCLPESGRLQTNDLGEGQVSVRFVSTERKQVSAAIKLCTWPDLQRGKQCTKSFDSESITFCRISGCQSDVYQRCFHLTHATEIAEDSLFVQSEII